MAVDRTLHHYTLGEELVSAISHGLGALLAAIGTGFAVAKALPLPPVYLVSVLIFGISMTLLYTVSTIYHALAPNGGKKVLRILDHCFVFLLITGTYAPYALAAMNNVYGYVLFAANCAAAVVGITLTAVDMKKYAKFSMVCYIVMGWMVLLCVKPLFDALPVPGFVLLVAGGVVYTLGAVVYGLGKKGRYIHSIWHFFVLAGSVLHFLSIYLYIL